eukprot:CAMPEP_0179085884 /NCGR_PEP_ID=MMETSP0796-20121207/38923_1 /TAXON_ID=73915 /ORGANISM="Pyrodinium bahamense, Strain pbaha01" /LENGTH=133 /DNA_ID=CAMNT_0020783335 /DNA_START=46 /DNA_END=444 /DNA_ORIENTATION=-
MGANYSQESECARAAVGMLQELANTDVNPNARDSRGLTPLMIAAMHGHEDCLRCLLQRGADLDARDGRGWTALMHAAFRGQGPCLRLLAEHGADLDARDFLGTTAAMRAAMAGMEHARRKGHVLCMRALQAEA